MVVAKPFPKRPVKLALMVVGVLLLAIVGLHIWFVNNARGVLKEMVYTKSNGKVKLDLSKLSFDFFSNTLSIQKADLVSTDSLTQPITHHVQFRQLTLRVSSFWPLLLKRKLLLDSIKLQDPNVEVLLWRPDTTSNAGQNNLSLTQEMGRLYNSMLDVLDDFGIRRIRVENAKISLVNKMKPGTEPVTVSKIYLDLVRTAQYARKRDEFINEEQSIDLWTTNQNIALPGGRHRIAFKAFNLHLFRKRIDLDSCTLTARTTDSSNSSYTIFFKKLSLVGVDFDAMYRYNLIRADSVYCQNPLFDINLDPSSTASKKKKERPDLEKLIRELTGDLDLAYIGVKDAGIRIDILGEKSRSIFNSNQDDFELRGLRIHADSSQPVVVKRFDMLVRDYHLYNEDSSTAYAFDSIQFVNNQIVLNNFTVNTTSNKQERRNYRDFRVPYFALTGLDWNSLVFDQTLNAEEAVLYNPIIHYIKRKPSGPRKRVNLFAALESLDNIMTLNRVNIINGQVDMQLGTAASFNLQNVNLGLYSNQLLQSTNREGLRRAVDRFSFSSGVIKLKDINVQLQNVQHTRNNLIYADKVLVNSATGKIKATVNHIFLDNMLLDDRVDQIMVDGVRWGSASVKITSMPKGKKGKAPGGFTLKNVAAKNTRLQYSGGNINASTFFRSLQLASLVKNGQAPLQLEGLSLAGNKLNVRSGDMDMEADSYDLKSDQVSRISGLRVSQIKGPDTLLFLSPLLRFTADISNLGGKDIYIENVEAERPVITVRKWSEETQTAKAANPSMAIRVDRFMANEPEVNIRMHRSDSVTIINLPQSEKSFLSASGIVVNKQGISLGRLAASTTSATLVKRTGEVIGVEKGKVDLEISDIFLAKKSGQPEWRAVINSVSLQNPRSLTFRNRNTLTVEQASIGNLSLSSAYLTNVEQLIKYNVSAWLRTATGQYVDSNTTLKWYNANYDYGSKTVSLDSFTYHPTQPRDSVIAKSKYQTDYKTFRSGAVRITNFNLEQYEKDSAVFADTISISSPVLTIYRDKQPPFLAGVLKPLPVDMIRQIGLPLAVRGVNIYNGTLTYTERHAKTREEGTLILKDLNAQLANIKNRNISGADSLQLSVNAYLMDSALVSLRVRESYSDSLSGFLMTLRMQPTSLTFLNPVIAPLSNVIITSGRIDSLHLEAIGRKDVALGKMSMYYRNLRIKLVKDGDPTQSSFTDKVISFLANTFIIKKNNRGRTGIAYFERLQDRGFFNYVVKITFSGMASSIGVKSNRKVLKQYKKKLEASKLPPIELK